ncbi:MAG TPA: hypothetical protein VIY69_16890 [Candidatus Acidoferrales bacterium]
MPTIQIDAAIDEQATRVAAENEAWPSEPISALDAARRFIAPNAWFLAAISAALLIPIFWHRHLVENDFSSHVYNAWLATLVKKGQAPGVFIVRQWNNVLVDQMLTFCGSLFGWSAGERIVQCASVLIFFWGAFALIAAASRRAAWFLLPAVAMIAYGWTFEIGFSNYYLSLGLGCWAVALLWRGVGRELWLGLLLLPLIMLAHAFGFVFAVGAVAYLRIRERLPRYWKTLPLLAAAALIWLARSYLVRHYPVHLATALPVTLMNGLNGVDQIVLGGRYRNLARALFLFGVIFFGIDCVERLFKSRSRKSLSIFAVPAELYAISLFAIALLPDGVKLPEYTAWVGFLLMRFSSIAALFSLCLLGCLKPQKWHLAAFGAVALVFFVFLYQDTGILSGMQEQADNLVAQLPPGERVTATVEALPDSRFYFITRIADRACVERCFSYDDYEPATRQFRLRAMPGSPVVSDSLRDVEFMESGVYVVPSELLPMNEIYQCSRDRITLCMRPLRAGELNGPMPEQHLP